MLGHRQQDFEDHGSPPRKGKGKKGKGRQKRECKIGVARQFEETQEGLQLTRSNSASLIMQCRSADVCVW